jgi:cytochrome bd-type quinol oxidase subunit 2
MSNLIGKNKWYILGSIGLVGVGVAVAFLFSGFRKIKNRNPKKLLFVGDSITTGQSAYPSIIQSQRSDLTIDKVSSVGKQTSWMLDNLKKPTFIE